MAASVYYAHSTDSTLLQFYMTSFTKFTTVLYIHYALTLSTVTA